jgi:2-polyprenyl-3-methyl-5-hydroxy-6-metoxy-1,4-benzoquinol methylase
LEVVAPANFDVSDLKLGLEYFLKEKNHIHYQTIYCKKYDFQYASPVLPLIEMGKHLSYRHHFYGHSAQIKASQIAKKFEPFLQNYLKKDSSILEINCDQGWLLKEIYKLGYENVFGMEHFDRIESNTFLKNRVFWENLDDFDIEVRNFDLIIALDCMERFSDPRYFIQTLMERLSPNGLMIVSINPLPTQFSEDLLSIHEVFRFSLKSFETLVQHCELNVVNSFSLEVKNTNSIVHSFFHKLISKEADNHVISRHIYLLQKNLFNG